MAARFPLDSSNSQWKCKPNQNCFIYTDIKLTKSFFTSSLSTLIWPWETPLDVMLLLSSSLFFFFYPSKTETVKLVVTWHCPEDWLCQQPCRRDAQAGNMLLKLTVKRQEAKKTVCSHTVNAGGHTRNSLQQQWKGRRPQKQQPHWKGRRPQKSLQPH